MAVEGLVLVHPTDATKNVTLNGSKWGLEEINLGNPSRRDELVGSLDASGSIPFRVAPRDNREVTIRVRLLDATTANAAMDSIGALEAVLESAERFAANDPNDPVLDHVRLVYTPAGSTYSYSLIVYAADIVEVPRSLEGDDAGFFINRPVLTITALCDPFAYGADKGQYLDTALALGPSILLPLDGANGATDISGNGRNGTGAGGVTIGGHTPGPLAIGDTGATDFDGSNDRIATTYSTRRNLILNPSFETNTTGWSLSSTGWTGATFTREAASWSGVSGEYAGRIQGTKDANSTQRNLIAQRPTNDVSVTPGDSYSASIYIDNVAPGNVGTNFSISWWTSGGAFISSNGSGLVTATGTHLLTATGTAPATAATCRVAIQTVSNQSGQVVDVKFDAALLERSSSLGTYFDGSVPGNNQSGWLGTAHASASDLGVFANGTTRTFAVWIKREITSGSNIIWGNGNTPDYDCLQLGGTGTLALLVGAGTGITFTGTPVTLNAWAHVVVVFDEVTNTASLYINGSLHQTSTSVTRQWSSGGNAAQKNFHIADYGGQYFDGKMAGLAVYERGLNATEIKSLYDSGALSRGVPPRTTWLSTTVSGSTADSKKVPASGAIAGDVPPWTRVRLEDKQTQARNRIVLGVRQGENAVTPTIGAAGLTAISGTVSSGTMTTTSTEWTIAAQLPRQTRRGTFRVLLVGATSATTGSVRFIAAPAGSSRRTGSTAELVNGSTIDADLGEVAIDSAWDGWIETRGSVIFTDVVLIPTDSFIDVTSAVPGRQLVGAVQVADTLRSSSASINGRGFTTGSGTWSNTSGSWPVSNTDWARRTATSMTDPAFAIAGSTNYLDVDVRARVRRGGANIGFTGRSIGFGIFLRYDWPANGFLALYYSSLLKRFTFVKVLGTGSGYADIWYAEHTDSVSPGFSYDLQAQVTADGRWYVSVRSVDGPAFFAEGSGQDKELAVGGRYGNSTARAGLYDFHDGIGSVTRDISNFQVSALTGVTSPPIASNGSLTLAGPKLLTADNSEHPYAGSSGVHLRPGADNNLTTVVRHPSTATAQVLDLTVDGWPRYLAVPHG